MSKLLVTLFDYDQNKFQEKVITDIADCLPFKEENTVTWINVDGLEQVDVIARLDELFGIHPLVQEDIVNTDHRPKIEDYGNYLFIIVKMIYLDQGTQEIFFEQVSFVLGENYVLSFQQEAGQDTFDAVRERIRKDKGRIRKMGSDYLTYALLDTIVDHYFVVADKVEEHIALLEEEITVKSAPGMGQNIHHLKRQLIFLRKQVGPVRELINSVLRAESKLIKKPTLIYFRDVYDNVVHVLDTIETSRDILSGLHDIYLSSISNRMNEVMKVLTVIATIFIPLTFIAGVYGMNFKYMPELEWHWGYFAVWGVMLTIAAGMIMYFKKKDWF